MTPTTALQIYQMARFGAVLVISVLLARLGISNQEIGQYEFFLFLVSVASSFWLAGLIQGLMPLYGKVQNQYPTAAQGELLWTTLAALLGLGVFASLLLLATEPWYEQKLNIPVLGSLLPVYLTANAASTLMEFGCLLRKRVSAMLWYGGITLSAQVLGMAWPLLSEGSVAQALAILTLVTLAKLVWLGIWLVREVGLPRFHSRWVAMLWGLGSPLALSALMAQGADFVNNGVVLAHFSTEDYALFRYGARHLPLLTVLANALSNGFAARIATEGLEPEVLSDLKRRSGRLLNRLGPLVLALVATSPWLYPMVFRAEFVASAPIFNLYLVAGLSRLIFPEALIIGQGHTRWIAWVSVAELSLNIVASWLLGRIWGLPGVAMGLVLGYALERVLGLWLVKSRLGIGPEQYGHPVRLLAYAAVVLGLSSWAWWG